MKTVVVDSTKTILAMILFLGLSIYFQYRNVKQIDVKEVKEEIFKQMIEEKGVNELETISDDILKKEFNNMIVEKSLSAIVVAPFLEEIIFRYGLYQFLKYSLTPLHALIISSCFFSFVHSNNHINSYIYTEEPMNKTIYMNHLSMTFFAGLLLGLIFEKYGLYTSILTHSFLNFLPDYLYFFATEDEIRDLKKKNYS
jgi:hypothetical protein